MKELEKDSLVILKEKRLDVGYNYYEPDVLYAKTSIAVVNNPYTGQLDIAVKPYFPNEFINLVPVYSYEEDIQCQEGFRIAMQCQTEGKPIPDDLDKFMRNMMARKEAARKQADAYVAERLSLPCDKVSTGYTRSVWREDVVDSKVAQEMFEDYKKQAKA